MTLKGHPHALFPDSRRATWRGAIRTAKLYVTGGTIAGATLSTSTITQESWTAPTLLNSWVNFGSPFQTARYRKDASGIVHVQGLIKDGTATDGTTLFTLPAGYRPDAQLIFMCGQFDNVYGRIDVHADGTVDLGTTGHATWQNITLSFAT